MRHVLELCVEMDSLAERTYSIMAEACEEPALSGIFTAMSAEERAHVEWWRNLLAAWNDGLLPDAFNDSVALEAHLESMREKLSQQLEGIESLGCEGMLDAAVRMEFFMIDPVFGELLDLVEPARAQARHAAYAQHIDRLVGAVQDRYGTESLTGFLAGLLRRTWKDNVRLASAAITDPLTGLANRRALDTQLQQWAAWSQRYSRPLAIVLLDLDDFKHVNDTYGHSAGDRALQMVAKTLRRQVRTSDMVARYGGDEFAVVAPELTPAEFDQMCGRIVRAVRALRLADETGRRIELSVSVGGVVTTPSADETRPTPEELLAAADRGLYAAKRGGKDRSSVPLLLDAMAAV